jgi:hypothetical protein
VRDEICPLRSPESCRSLRGMLHSRRTCTSCSGVSMDAGRTTDVVGAVSRPRPRLGACALGEARSWSTLSFRVLDRLGLRDRRRSGHRVGPPCDTGLTIGPTL